MNKVLIAFFLSIFYSAYGASQSCVCFRENIATDYKNVDFIAHVRINEVYYNYPIENQDYVRFDILEILKGPKNNSLIVQQEVGNNINNDKCRLYLKANDELMIFGNLDNGQLISKPCLRNKFAEDSDFVTELNKYRMLRKHHKLITDSRTFCTQFNDNIQFSATLQNILIKSNSKLIGIYAVVFNDDQTINKTEVVESLSREIDVKIQIALIKSSWAQCAVNNNNKFIVVVHKISDENGIRLFLH
ncbi:hypothetical protein [Nonlabens tegetincola]|uniref:hypothetical protein n=1 Tax=Nonlabens tegetincola TaxID=323273 RepID=UPI0030C829BC